MSHTPRLVQSERARLIAILSRLQSNFDGERQAAALAAVRFLHDRDLTWEDIVLPPDPGQPILGCAAATESWRATIAACLRQPGSLRPWERKFLQSLRRFPRLSLKQRAILNQIADRVLEQVVA
jgi:hypothetical protein